jgi:hypothetical protein
VAWVYWWLHPVTNADILSSSEAHEVFDDLMETGNDPDWALEEARAYGRRLFWEALVLGPRLLRVADWLRDRNRRRVLGFL